MKSKDEEELLRRVKSSDQTAYQTLFERYHDALYKVLRYRVRDSGLAEDFTQEAFVRVWLNRHTLKPQLSFFSLVARIGQNLIQDHFKHQQVRIKHQDHVRTITEKPSNDPHRDLKLNQLQSRIHEVARNHLPKKCRNIFMLSRVAGLSNQEIADSLNITKKTVENQLYHALKILRKKCAEFL